MGVKNTMNKLLHNCPNCGAQLTHNGYCEYCKTKIRYANSLEIESDWFRNEPVEILLKKKNPDGTMVVMPFIGKLEDMRIRYEYGDVETLYADNNPYYTVRSSPPIVSLNFEGTIGVVESEEVIKNSIPERFGGGG